MADQNQQMADIMQQVNYELERYGRLTGATADALTDAKTGVDGFSQAVKKVPIALTDTFSKLAKTMNSGERGASSYNDAVGSMADAASAATTVLSAMIPGGPIVKMLVMGLGKLASVAFQAAAGIYKLASEQGDKQYNAYQQLTKAGAAAAGGTTQFAEELRKASVPLQDLDGYVRMIGENSQDLALFGVSVQRGVEDFNNVRNVMKPYRAELERLGLNAEQQNEAVLKYMSIQTRLGNAGRLQAQSYEQTALAAKRYIEEQDVLTKLTGVERKEREKTLMDAMRNQRYAATLDDLERQGKKDEAKALRDSMSLINETAGPATAKAFQDAVTGFITPESQKILMASQGVVQEQIALIKEGRVKTDKEFADSNERMIKSLGRASVEFNQLGQLGIFDKIMGPYEESRRAQQFIDKKDQDLSTRILAIRQEQAKQQAGVDSRLRGQSEDRVKKLDIQLKKEELVDKAVDAAVFASNVMSDALLIAADAALGAAEGLNSVKQESKKFWASILEFFGLGGSREMTAKEKELAAKEEAAENARVRAEAERKITEAARKDAEEKLKVETKTRDEALDRATSAKNQLQGVGGQAGVNFDVQRLQRLERVATAKVEQAKTPDDIIKAKKEAENIRLMLSEAMAEQARLQKIVAEQTRVYEAAKLAAQQRQLALDKARAADDTAKKQEDDATRKKLQAQAQTGMGGNKPDAQAANEANMQRRERERDTASLANITKELAKNRENTEAMTERLAKLDKTKDDREIKQLERVIETFANRTKELEAEAEVLKERIKKNTPKPAPPPPPPQSGAAPAKPPAAAPQAGTTPPANAGTTPSAATSATPKETPRARTPPPKPLSMGQDQLAAMGIKIKKGDVQKEGGQIDPRLIKLAQEIQRTLPEFEVFTGFNDSYHRGNNSKHAAGMAMDFTLKRHPTVEEGKAITKYLKELGAGFVLDEYNFRSSKATGPHFHAELPAYEKGGIVPGPTIALLGEKQPEAVVPLPDGKSIPINMGSALTDEMQRLSAMMQTVGQDVKRPDTPNVIRLTQQDVMAAGGIGPTMGGYNEYMGYNQGPMSTDLAVIKDIAASLGAFDQASQTITDPATWKQILGSGLATNYQLGMAEFGTKMLPGVGIEIGERIKEIITTSGTQPDTSQAVQQVAQEFRKIMQEFLAAQTNETGAATVALLSQLVKDQQQGNDTNKKMLQAVRN